MDELQDVLRGWLERGLGDLVCVPRKTLQQLSDELRRLELLSAASTEPAEQDSGARLDERVSVDDYDSVVRMLSEEQMARERAARERDAAELERDVAERDARQYQAAVESMRREREALLAEIERLRAAALANAASELPSPEPASPATDAVKQASSVRPDSEIEAAARNWLAFVEAQGYQMRGQAEGRLRVAVRGLHEPATPATDDGPRWIPCSERMPEARQAVLYWARYGDEPRLGRRVQLDGQWYWGADQSDYDHQVTHWMPLPEPPPTASS